MAMIVGGDDDPEHSDRQRDHTLPNSRYDTWFHLAVGMDHGRNYTTAFVVDVDDAEEGDGEGI